MTPLEKVNSMKMPFAELKGVTFTEAEPDRVVARMLVRPDLCTLGHTLHGGAIMALADSVGAMATVINLPEDAKGTTTIESKTNFIGGAKEGMTVIASARAYFHFFRILSLCAYNVYLRAVFDDAW